MNDYKVIIIALICRKKNSEILLVKRNREPELGKWSLLGGIGALEQEKDPQKAIAMEVTSDISAEFVDNKLLQTLYDSEKGILRIYYTGNISGDIEIRNPNVTGEAKWFSIEEALNQDLAFSDYDKKIIKMLR